MTTRIGWAVRAERCTWEYLAETVVERAGAWSVPTFGTLVAYIDDSYPSVVVLTYVPAERRSGMTCPHCGSIDTVADPQVDGHYGCRACDWQFGVQVHGSAGTGA